ncbi:type VII secretion protein EccB [Streptomyces sp. NPDC057702]|uniref:type VII secretion protein EccB n=1 Tax=unclassified Streptomyces TaxID=2593676 RepID=UPI0036CE26EE
MASRRDELNAYTFARKRVVAAFLQPTPAGTEEGAPRALRAVLPGVVVGALVLAGFGAWGMFKPKAPKGWDEPKANVIIGSDSTTRYVVLETNGKAQLHPVLNLSSAKLLLNPSKGKVIKVDEKILDNGKIPHGPTIGIPYAPDRLPDARDAGRAKRWAVCEQPGGRGSTVQKATFVLADRETARVEGTERLRGGQVLYVRDQNGARYLVDAKGAKYLIGGPNWRERSADYSSTYDKLLLRTLVGNRSAHPQRVTDDWLRTLRDGTPITFPHLPGTVATDAGIAGLSEDEGRVGTVLRAQTGTGPQHYVVLPGTVRPVSDFTAELLLSSPETDLLNQAGKARDVDAQAFTPEGPEDAFYGDRSWPQAKTEQINALGGDTARDTVCNVLREAASDGSTKLSTWAGRGFPATIAEGGSTTYVTPGTGLLYRETRGRQSSSGSLFLVTDTGLRYAVQTNNDSSSEESAIGTDGKPRKPDEEGRREIDQARIRLGYQDVKPVRVPIEWSSFLAKGPRLDTTAARQPQGA